MSSKIQVLILCTANSARSQMGEGLLRDIAGHKMDVYSAGSKPSVVNPYAIQAMADYGVDISGHSSDHLEQYLNAKFDYIITVCDNAAETCSVFPGSAQRIHWGFPDPADVDGDDAEILSSFVEVRDGLEKQLREWIESLS